MYRQSGGFTVVRTEGGYLLGQTEEARDAKKTELVRVSREQAAAIMAWEHVQHDSSVPASEAEPETSSELFVKSYNANLKNLADLKPASEDFVESLP